MERKMTGKNTRQTTLEEYGFTFDNKKTTRQTSLTEYGMTLEKKDE